MSDNEAIKILGLPNSFNEKDELTAYHKLAKEYHQDNHMNASKEEQKRLNEKMAKLYEAHNYLKNKYFTPKNLKKRVNIDSSNSYSNTYDSSFWGYSSNSGYSRYNDKFDIFRYRSRMIEKIIGYVKGIDFYHFPKYINEIMNEIRVCAHIYILNIEQSNTNGDIDYYFKEFKTRVYDSYYQKIILEYAKHNNMDSDFFKDKIDFECNAIDFYEQLENTKKQYESEMANEELNRLQERLKKETEKYKEYSGYLNLKGFITKAIEETIRIINKNNEDIETSIQNMHWNITKVFEQHFQEKLTEYANKYKNYAGYNEFVKIRIPSKIELYTSYAKERNFAKASLEELMQKFQKEIENIFAKNFAMMDRLEKIKNRFIENSECFKVNRFTSLYEELKTSEQRFNKGEDITTRLDDIQRKLIMFLNMRENNEALNKAYNTLITNYHHKLASMNPMDYEEVLKVNEIFAAAMKVFERIETQEISIDSAIDALPRITFNNYDEDKTLIENVDSFKIASGIYIKNPDYMKNNGLLDSFCYLKEENGKYIMTELGLFYNRKVVSVKTINNEYISIEEFLKNGEYIGKEDYRPNSFLNDLILYKYKNIYIVKQKMTKHFNIEKGLSGNLRAISDYSEYGGDYKDPNKLIDAIIKQVKLLILSNKISDVNNNIHYFKNYPNPSFEFRRHI